MARPTRLTPTLLARITAAVRRGVYPSIAAVAAGISARTFARWIGRGKEASRGIHHQLYCAIYQAESGAEVEATLRLRKAAKRDARTTVNLLQRRYPERWSPYRPPHKESADSEAPPSIVFFRPSPDGPDGDGEEPLLSEHRTEGGKRS